jgi:hypothetical protein
VAGAVGENGHVRLSELTGSPEAMLQTVMEATISFHAFERKKARPVPA